MKHTYHEDKLETNFGELFAGKSLLNMKIPK